MAKRDDFATFHPIVNFLYFVSIIGFTMFFMHPVCLALSLFCAAAYSLYLNGKKALRIGLLYMLPMIIFTAMLNPLFNHQGATILTYLRNGNPLTMESILYGIAAATMLVTAIIWFACFNAVMTSDKFIYLFGRAIPALSLILSMVLRLIPRFKAQIKVISNAQKCIGRDISTGNIFQKVRHGIKILSIMVTWALENSIETADSMKCRGYGLPGRTAFSVFRFHRRDGYALIYIFVCVIVVLLGVVAGVYHFRYFPTISGQWTGMYTILVFVAYFALGFFPVMVNLKSRLLWVIIPSDKL